METTDTKVVLMEPDDAKLIEDADLYKEFISESCDHLRETETNLLGLEGNPDDMGVLNNIFRAVHSIKGSAGFMVLDKIQCLSHELETALDNARNGRLRIGKDATDILLEAIDTVGKLMDRLAIRMFRVTGIECERLGKYDSEDDINIDVSVNNVRSIVGLGVDESAEEGVDTVGDDAGDGGMSADAGGEDNGYDDGAVAAGLTTLDDILRKDGLVTREQFEVAREAGAGETLAIDGVAENAAEDEQDGVAVAKPAARSGEFVQPVLKVDVAKLDALFDMVGELVVTHSLVNEEMAGTLGRGDNSVNQNLLRLGKIVHDIQEQTMSLRMVPLKQTFQRMTRLVRTLASNAGKNVRLDVSGAETELDKGVIEKIADPLVHILRNSVDHGIESAADRKTKNKPEEGTISLNAFHRGGNIVIEVGDDGAGLSKSRICKKAIEKGILREFTSLSEEQVFNLIFAPGFSTADKVTNVSGRGVGMDVVKRNIESLHGNVDIVSGEGEGTTFTIRLPLTLAVIDGIVVRVGNVRYIIPIITVEKSIRPEKEMLSTIRKQEEVLNIREEIIPLARLHEIFALNADSEDLMDSIVVIVQAINCKFGIMADALLGQQQVVIKGLGGRFKRCKGISGAAIMGNGEVGLIIDVNGIKELAFGGAA